MENLENEVWKIIPTIVNKNGSYSPIGYEVSNMGRVRTKRQRYGRPRKDTGLRKELPDYHIINGRLDGYGYTQYALYNAEKQKRNFRTHILVMQAFVGLPEEGQIICHYDDDKQNNRLDNLRYDTHKANAADMKRNRENKV
jgi:hypothetical protein